LKLIGVIVFVKLKSYVFTVVISSVFEIY
jgi:hypothetical protein